VSGASDHLGGHPTVGHVDREGPIGAGDVVDARSAQGVDQGVGVDTELARHVGGPWSTSPY
jgi:hypothetical protein